MEAKNVIVNERTIKGYIELHKSYTEPLSDGIFLKVFLKKILPVIGVGAAVAVSLILFGASVSTVIMPLVAANLVGIAVIDFEQVKERKELQKKYPFLDLTLSCEDLEEILVDSEAIVYDDECFYHYDENVFERKKYIQKCDEVLNDIMVSDYKTSKFEILDYSDVPKVEIPKVKKLGTIQDERKRISK